MDNPFELDINAIEQELHYRTLRSDYYSYVKDANPEYVDSVLHKYLCSTIQTFIEKRTPSAAFDVLLLSIPPQHGKGYPVNTPVLTTKGWKKHGELAPGDYVYNDLGLPVRVLGNQTPYMHPCMTVTFANGEQHTVTREHLWKIEVEHERRDPKHHTIRVPTIMETQDIFKKKHRRAPAIRAALALQNPPSTTLPIEPYVLGLWLGDGCSVRNCIGVSDTDAPDICAGIKLTPYHCNSINKNMTQIVFGTKTDGHWDATTALRQLNVYNNKHIPLEYLLSSEQQRWELLRGLMDTDGSIDTRGRCEYCSVNEQLAKDVKLLCRSLGIKANINPGDATIDGQYISPKYRVMFTPDKTHYIFKLKRKQDRLINKSEVDRVDKYRYFIKKIESTTPHLVSCISVEGGMYLAGEELIPTHNSLTITETLPSWYLGKHPSHDAIIVSYNEDTAVRFGRRNREKLERYSGNLFPDYIPKTSPWSNTEFESTKKGRCLSRGVMSGITGNPAHLFIIDDPIKNRQEADSPTTRATILNEYYSTYRTRIKPGGKLIVIQTRWHEEDLFGALERTVPPHRLTVVNLPCECESENDPLGRNIGDALCPEIGRGNNWLVDFKGEYMTKEGKRAWTALYQGKPMALDGNIIPVQDFQYYDVPPANLPYKLISVDAAFKAGEDNDYVVAQVWGKIGNKYYLLDQERDHFTFMQTLNVIRELRVKHPDVLIVLIEDKANGSAIINVLSDEMEGIIPVEPSGGKVSRAHAITPAIESKRVFIPRYAAFTASFIAECSYFPNGSNDDQVDSMTQALHHMIYADADVVNKLKIKYRVWTADMWEDFEKAGDELQNQLLDMWGHPEEWREDDD